MSAMEEIVTRLIASGMDPAHVATLVIDAFAERGPKPRSAGAERAARYRDRKRDESVTKRDEVTTNLTVTNRDESVTNRDTVTPPISILSSFKESKKDGTRAKKRSSIASDFKLSEEGIQFASNKGLSPPKVVHQCERFVDYHKAKGTLFADWEAAWRTWVNNSIKFESEGKKNQGGFKWNGIEGVV